MISCKGLYSKLWYRLSKNLCSCGKDGDNEHSFICSCPQRLATLPVRCEECSFAWRFVGRDIYGPTSRIHPSASHRPVCKLKKSLYGLKQSPCAWFGRLTKAMRILGFFQTHGHHSLFYKRSTSGGVTILLVYVDDMIITRDDIVDITQLQNHLKNELDIKALGQLKYFLGIEVAYREEELFLSQRK